MSESPKMLAGIGSVVKVSLGAKVKECTIVRMTRRGIDIRIKGGGTKVYTVSQSCILL